VDKIASRTKIKDERRIKEHGRWCRELSVKIICVLIFVHASCTKHFASFTV